MFRCSCPGLSSIHEVLSLLSAAVVFHRLLTPILGHLLASFCIDISPTGSLGSESGILKGFNSIPGFLTAQGFLLGYWLRLCGVFNKRK
jgi:hypothetical protein